MAWDDVLARIAVHLATAGAGLRRPVTDVRLGEPGEFGGNPLVAYWYVSSAEGHLIPNTLSRASYTETIRIRWYWPMGTRSTVMAADTERELRTAVRGTTGAIWADYTLGGNCTGVDFTEAAESGWVEVASGWVRTMTLTLGIVMVDLDTIGV